MRKTILTLVVAFALSVLCTGQSFRLDGSIEVGRVIYDENRVVVDTQQGNDDFVIYGDITVTTEMMIISYRYHKLQRYRRISIPVDFLTPKNLNDYIEYKIHVTHPMVKWAMLYVEKTTGRYMLCLFTREGILVYKGHPKIINK